MKLGNRHIFTVKMQDFRGQRYTGNWTLELYGDLSDVLTPGISNLDLKQELLIVGGSVDYLNTTIKLNWRLTSMKCNIIHLVNDVRVNVCILLSYRILYYIDLSMFNKKASAAIYVLTCVSVFLFYWKFCTSFRKPRARRNFMHRMMSVLKHRTYK